MVLVKLTPLDTVGYAIEGDRIFPFIEHIIQIRRGNEAHDTDHN